MNLLFLQHTDGARCRRSLGLTLICAIAGLTLSHSRFAQNVVTENGGQWVLPPRQWTLEETRDVVRAADPAPDAKVESEIGRRIARKLEDHVAELLKGWPWMPLHHTLGISGYEVVFDHPDELFYSLSIAVPWLTKDLQGQVLSLLETELQANPPFVRDGYFHNQGRPRESYRVPPHLRSQRRGRADSLFGVYALWAYSASSSDLAAGPRQRWPEIRERCRPVLEKRNPFDPIRRDYSHDEAERLNGDLAGSIGAARFAALHNEQALRNQIESLVAELLQKRINLERVNPDILTRTHSTTKHLHCHKLARYCDLVPEIACALRSDSDACAQKRLGAFRQDRNAWYLAYGDRLIGGENYTNPLHFSRALFAGAALIERLGVDELQSFLDVPWCPADFYFIEKSVYALRAANSVSSFQSPGRLPPVAGGNPE